MSRCFTSCLAFRPRPLACRKAPKPGCLPNWRNASEWLEKPIKTGIGHFHNGLLRLGKDTNHTMKWTCGETCKSYWISILPKSLCRRISKEFLWYLKWEFVWNDCFTPFMHIILSNITIIILFQITSHVSTWLRFHGDGMLCHLAPIIAPCVSPPTIVPPLAWSSKNKIETYCNHLQEWTRSRSKQNSARNWEI